MHVRTTHMSELDHNFRPDLSGSVRVGGRFTDYYNNPASQDDASPYAMASLRYTYLPESYLQAGVTYDYSASSVFSANTAGNLTLNAQSTSVFASINHRITPKLYGSITAQFQNSTYYGGTVDGQSKSITWWASTCSIASPPTFPQRSVTTTTT